MKKSLMFVLPLLLIIGCSSPEPINYETSLTKRSGVWYTKDTNKPYSGEVFSLYDNGKIKTEGSFKNGERDGEWIIYKWGQKVAEGEYKNGKEDGKWTFFEDDPPYHMTGKGFFKDGNQVGKWTDGYENGQKRWEGTYKNGEQDGVWTYWSENGQKSEERTYKGGKRIDIIGEWESDLNITKQALKDEGLEGEELEMRLMRFSSRSMTFEFKEDGTLMVSFGASESESGEWKLDGSTLKTRQGQEKWEQLEISLSGDELVMKIGEESLGFKRVK